MDSQKEPGLNIEQLVDQHGDMLFRYAYTRVGHHDIAEDLVQETFIAAYTARDEFSGRSSVQSWLVGILRHKIVDHHRSSARQNSNQADDSWQSDFFDKSGHWINPPVDWKSDPSAVMETDEFWLVLKHCLDNLAEPAAQAFVLRVMEELSAKDVCSDLNISDSNLWVRLHRARIQLRQCLEVNWFVDAGEGAEK